MLSTLRERFEQRSDAEPAGEAVSWCLARVHRRVDERRRRISPSPHVLKKAYFGYVFFNVGVR